MQSTVVWYHNKLSIQDENNLHFLLTERGSKIGIIVFHLQCSSSNFRSILLRCWIYILYQWFSWMRLNQKSLNSKFITVVKNIENNLNNIWNLNFGRIRLRTSILGNVGKFLIHPVTSKHDIYWERNIVNVCYRLMGVEYPFDICRLSFVERSIIWKFWINSWFVA